MIADGVSCPTCFSSRRRLRCNAADAGRLTVKMLCPLREGPLRVEECLDECGTAAVFARFRGGIGSGGVAGEMHGGGQLGRVCGPGGV